MAIVTGKSQRWRVWAAHAALWVLLAFTAALKAGQPVSGLVPNIGAA